MQLLRQMLPSATLAAVVAAAFLSVLARGWKRASRCAAAIAIGAGYMAGHVLSVGWAPFPPRSATHWLSWFAVTGVMAAATDALFRPTGRIRLVTWTIISTIASRLILQPKFTYAWSAAEGWLWVFAVTLGVVGLTCALDLIERGPLGPATLFSITTVLCAGTCLALILSGSLLLGQLAGVLTAIAATCFLLLITVAKRVPPSGAAVPLALLCAGLWLSGFFYAELPPASALFFVVAPAAALLRLGKKNYSSWRGLAFRSALVVIPVAIALALAFWASPALDY